MSSTDWKRDLKQLYNPSPRAATIVEVPELAFLMLDGTGNPNGPAFAEAVETLYSVAYTLKFMLKKGPLAIDFAVMPLEGLWWSDDMASFTALNKDDWKWTAMIAQPPAVSAELYQAALAQAAKKKALPALARLRFECFSEGQAAQIMHMGPFATEAPTIMQLHQFIAEQGYALRGKHHEIYLSDLRRTAPAKLKTVIRQPIAPAGT